MMGVELKSEDELQGNVNSRRILCLSFMASDTVYVGVRSLNMHLGSHKRNIQKL